MARPGTTCAGPGAAVYRRLRLAGLLGAGLLCGHASTTPRAEGTPTRTRLAHRGRDRAGTARGHPDEVTGPRSRQGAASGPTPSPDRSPCRPPHHTVAVR
ncbi:hypothetical protein LT493_22820 [Streptomyces tricolor]|nr:hypothetical protein [Streptomyces tricolor]